MSASLLYFHDLFDCFLTAWGWNFRMLRNLYPEVIYILNWDNGSWCLHPPCVPPVKCSLLLNDIYFTAQQQPQHCDGRRGLDQKGKMTHWKAPVGAGAVNAYYCYNGGADFEHRIHKYVSTLSSARVRHCIVQSQACGKSGRWHSCRRTNNQYHWASAEWVREWVMEIFHFACCRGCDWLRQISFYFFHGVLRVSEWVSE